MDILAFAKKHQRLLAVALFLLVLFLVMELAGIRENLSLDYIRATLVEHALWGAILFVLLFSTSPQVSGITAATFAFIAFLSLGSDHSYSGEFPSKDSYQYALGASNHALLSSDDKVRKGDIST